MLLVLLLVAAQPASVVYAAGALAHGAPCPVHAALAAPEEHHGSGHHHHGADEPAAAQADKQDSNPTVFGYNCCAGHMVGAFVSVVMLADAGWNRTPAAAAEPLPAAVRLPGDDPPPRILL